MKKFYSFALIVLTLFSCVLFSACGDKYKNLKMNFYSADGTVLQCLDFVIDSNAEDSSQTLGIEFSNIDSEDVGQIVVYSQPYELITVTNYKYDGNMCYVDLRPNMSSGVGAKLIVSHLSSGKKKSIDLNIEQKSTDLKIVNSTYVVTIPEEGVNTHQFNFTNVASLFPIGSTDKIYFKVLNGVPSGVNVITLEDVKGYEDVCTGFEVSSSVEDSTDITCVKIYPVTYMKGYEDVDKEKYAGKVITVYFKHTLNEDNLSLKSDLTEDLSIVELVANDSELNSFKVSLMNGDKNLNETSYFDLYDIELSSVDMSKVSAFAEVNNDIIVTAYTFTEEPVELKVTLKPKDVVGDIYPVEKVIYVKGNLKADDITVSKNGNMVSTSEKIDIFDYYEEGNSLGSLFGFTPVAIGGEVHKDLRNMQILVSPDILSRENVKASSPVAVASKLYALTFHHYYEFLNFTYDANLQMMVSEPISATSRVYIKYVDGEGLVEPSDFGIKVQMINDSKLTYWEEMENINVSLNFNRLEGVKEMSLEAGFYVPSGNIGIYDTPYTENPSHIYLNRLKGLDNLDDSVYRNFIDVTNGKVLSVDGGQIVNVKFEVTVTPMSNDLTNPLTICSGLVEKDGATKVAGENRILFEYNALKDTDVVALIFRKDTSIGDYKITFLQEGIAKASVICRIYESLEELTQEMVVFETNKTAFKNKDYTDLYEADYIVASGQDLNIALDLPQAVLSSGMVMEYGFEFEIGDAIMEIEEPEEPDVFDKNDYFKIKQDNVKFNNALLKFIKGTYIEDKVQYVNLIITVKIKTYSDLVTESDKLDESNKIVVKFFIYELIEERNISINHTNLTKRPKEYLGKYYEAESQAELKINMDAKLWNYVTGSNSVDWFIDNSSGASIIVDQEEKTYSIEFSSVRGQTNYMRTVRAYVYQFDKVFEFRCVFNVERPILTERLVINSEVKMTDDNLQEYYINLKKGEKYQVSADNISNLGDVTNKGIVIQVSDENGTAYNAKNYFEIYQDTSIIEVKRVDNLFNFKLIVFAKDVLKDLASSSSSGYNSPKTFIMNDFEGSEEGRYLNAYFVVNIILSDGTEANPYLIETADDFWKIDDSEHFKSSETYWKLMTSISLNDTSDKNEKIIRNFEGNLFSHISVDALGNQTANVYTIDGIELNKDTLNLFAGFKGNIKNIKFIVKYNYNISNNNDADVYLGLIDRNFGVLNNVSVEVSGSAILNGNAIYYYGGLAGENSGEISYTSGVGVFGTLGSEQNPVQGGAKVYLGGLVGKNTGNIIGCEKSQAEAGENEIVLNTESGNANSLSLIKINSILAAGSSIGGVIGLNTYKEEKVGIVHNAFVQAEINAPMTSNVGGVIGSNMQTNDVSLYINMSNSHVSVVSAILLGDYKLNAIYNVKSASKLVGKDNVGGIVGADQNGFYLECDYQILSEDDKSIVVLGNNNVGGIAGSSISGKFAYCSVMSYNWNYSAMSADDKSGVIDDVADISGLDYVGGIVGLATSSADVIVDGDSTVNDRVIVLYSSVNAYLQSTAEAYNANIGNIGGIISSRSGIAILYNVYFIGKLDGNVVYSTEETQNGMEITTHYFALDNNAKAKHNAVYSLNLEDGTDGPVLKKGNTKNGEVFNITSETDISNYWWWNANINGGYIFITTDQIGSATSKPIFDLAPDKITATVKGETNEALKRIKTLYYYDFTIDPNVTEDKLLELRDEYNRNQLLLDVIDVQAVPSGLGQVVVNVKSTNTNIVDITFDGKLLINNVGECELIFSSILNPNAGAIEERTIKIIVDYPLGNSFDISTSQTDSSKIISGRQEGIPKGNSKQYYVITNGYVVEKQIDNTEKTYLYKTQNNTNLEVKISCVTEDENFYISKYVSIRSQKVVKSYDAENKIMTFIHSVNSKTPFNVSVLDNFEDGIFKIEVAPYVTVNGVDKYFENGLGVVGAWFDLVTSIGATNISFSYDYAIVYPNDTVYLTMMFETDRALCANADGSVDIDALQQLIDGLVNNTATSNIILTINKSDNINRNSFKIYVDNSAYNVDNQIQKVVLRIEFSDMELFNEENFSIEVETLTGSSAIVNYIILPQRINKIEIKNYYYKNGATGVELVQENILKPNYPGYMIIDMVPDNGYYDYLEISDVTGGEEILFIQVDENGNAISVNYDPSSDGKGIKLYGQTDKSRLFVRTQISRNYSSRLHTVQVRAYSSNGTKIATFVTHIDVKMLPEIQANYILPDGSVGLTTPQNSKVVYLANGVDAKLTVETKNSNSNLDYSISAVRLEKATNTYVADNEFASKYQLINEANNHYVLRRKDTNISADDIGKKIKITLKTYAYLDNGDYDVAECSIEFVIASFVIHGVSVNNSIDNSAQKSIYGYYDKNIKLYFYFDQNDISYYKVTDLYDPFWDTVYEYEDGIENLEEVKQDKNLQQIYAILKEINSYDSRPLVEVEGEMVDNPHYGVNDYLILNNSAKDDVRYTETLPQGNVFDVAGSNQKVQLYENRLKVKNGYDKKTVEGTDGSENVVDDPKYMAVAFRLYYKDNKWQIEPYLNTTEADDSYIVDKNYQLDFIKATTWYEPDVVKDEKDFLDMKSGGQYILANDLVLENYSPLDVNLVEFDGNGRTITIKSFASFDEATLRAGLFKEIYDNMIVKNVVVKYESTDDLTGNWSFGYVDSGNITYADLCNNPNISYTEVKFGGIAAINNGIITNCTVQGRVALHASTLESKLVQSGTNHEISFFVGGLVADNASTGYITNSTTMLDIFAQANVSAFVYSNAGKIVSCGVESNTTLYGYNTNLNTTINVKMAGFAIENSGEISMSYVNLAKGENFLAGSIYDGTMSAKDISAGFVYSNSGKVLDSYVQMTNVGVNNNTFYGFVYSNSGSITRSYTYINGGLKARNEDLMFAQIGSRGLIDCIEIVDIKSGYTNGVETGLETVDVGNRFEKSVYEKHGFAFGDNESAVWTISSRELPTLVSTKEKVVYTAGKTLDGLLSFEKKVSDEIVDGVESIKYETLFANYGTKENPFIIHDLTTWNRYFDYESNRGIMTGYYRIVKDIDFSSVGDNPTTSTLTFKGNIQGNNMTLSGILLYSNNSLNAIGLFEKLESANDNTIKNAVRNLKIKATSVWASSTNAVGLLAGIIEDFNIYNITLDSQGLIIVGKNAVGGLAGIVRGEFDIDQVVSNVGANSTRASTLSNYEIYMSHNNGSRTSQNLSRVYYAGSIAGILDGYNRGSFNINAVRDINKKHYMVRNIIVSGNVTIVGDTVGAAFGLVGERVYVNNAKVEITGEIIGYQYAAGFVGEQRGVINNATIKLGEAMFEKSRYVSSGAVGFNLGGLVYQVEVKDTVISKTGYAQIVAGIVGRNVYGTVESVTFDGELFAYYTGGIIGADYNDTILHLASTGSGALHVDCKTNAGLIPTVHVEYVNASLKFEHLRNVSLSRNTFNYLVDNLNKYYSYKNDETNPDNLPSVTVESRVVGFVVGLSYKDSNVYKQGDVYLINVGSSKVTFNSETKANITYHDGTAFGEAPLTVTLKKDEVNADNDVNFNFTKVNVVNTATGKYKVIYLTGAVVNSFDAWRAEYSSEYVLLN